MKKIGFWVLVLILVFQLVGVYTFAAEESGSPKHITRVVSVVFDDSGSMYKDTDRWAYASYAMQAFTAMMGEDDVLYITYINATKNNGRVDLSKNSKQKTVDSFENTVFGGGTKNRIAVGIENLENAYSKYGANAQYYFVLMADGELDLGEGEYSVDLPNAVNDAAKHLSDAEFKAYYFFMGGDDSKINGVINKSASTGIDIVKSLKDISSDIMGRTDVTKDCKVSGGNFTFDLKYPALGITLFVQKNNTKFENVNIPISRDGKNASYGVDTYYVDCPSGILKNNEATRYDELFPKDPPGGFVSLISNGSEPLPKGSYSIDLSGCGADKDNVVILVEPAVKIGCKYSVGDSNTLVDFSEIKDSLRVGDTVTVRCGLYEMNADGTLGEAVPDEVLSPEYKLYVNDTLVTTKVSSVKNAYEIKISEEYENKEIKIEASLAGYQPFVLRERFGKLVIKPSIDLNAGDFVSEMTLTKPMWKDWLDGNGKLTFPLEKADESVLSELEIKLDDCDALPSGSCTVISDAMRLEGNNVVYAPKPAEGTIFSDLPESFSVSLFDTFSNSALASIRINVVQPTYSFEVENQLGGSDFNLAFLKNNAKYLKFNVLADYGDGSGKIPISDSDCESNIELSIDHGSLTGEANVNSANGTVSFVPKYDAEVDTDIDPSSVLGKDHTVFAVARIDGMEIVSQKITFTINNVDYQLHIENGISQAFTLDTIKGNSESVIFTVVADYDGNGSYEALADWDSAVYDKLVIDSGSLPGITKTEYDASGNVIGKSFTPVYNENNNNGIVFTEVAGKVHTVKGTIEQYSISNETTVDVLAPDYDLAVRKDGIKLIDYDLYANKEGVEFVITRNGRPLNSEELAGLAPYDIALSKNQKSVSIRTQPMEGNDGTDYLLCVPVYDFPGKSLLNWTSLFRVRDGEMEIRLTLGEDTAVAVVDIGTNGFAWIILLVVLGIILLILWIWFCYVTRIRFSKGMLYVARIAQDTSLKWKLNFVTPINPCKKCLRRFWSSKFFMPFSVQKIYVEFGKGVTLYTEKENFVSFKTSYPQWKAKSANGICVGTTMTDSISKAIISRDKKYDFNARSISGNPPLMLGGSDINENLLSVFLSYTSEDGKEKWLLFYVPARK